MHGGLSSHQEFSVANREYLPAALTVSRPSIGRSPSAHSVGNATGV